MIQAFSSTIRRKEMDAVLTCMVDEKIGPGELNQRLVQSVKEFIGCDGCVALRSPSVALDYALKSLDLEKGSKIMISALAPSWQYSAVLSLGYSPLVLDVDENTGLLSFEKIEEGLKNGGRLLILHETMGIIPADIEKIVEAGVLLIEDISHSAMATYTKETNDAEGASSASASEGKAAVKAAMKAGLFGTFAILGLEEHDVVTAGGGAVLIAPRRREWIVLKKFVDTAPSTDILPDINAALAWIQMKEFKRNEEARKKIYALYSQSLMRGKNKTFPRENDEGSTVWGFPVVLNGSFKDAKQYATRKEIEIVLAYEDSVISKFGEDLEGEGLKFPKAKALSLRCVLFPLYPRLSSKSVENIVKALGTLP